MRRIRTSLYYGEGWSEAQCGVAIHGLHVPSPMLLKLGYEIEFELPQPTSMSFPTIIMGGCRSGATARLLRRLLLPKRGFRGRIGS